MELHRLLELSKSAIWNGDMPDQWRCVGVNNTDAYIV